MEVIEHISELQNHLSPLCSEGRKVGLVPTMGALHQGHFSLCKASVKENDITVATIFVNPAQFNNQEDFIKYPKTLAADLDGFKAVGVDVVFCPKTEEMYPDDPVIRLDFGHLGKELEGKFRPGHFSGVALIVSKLFHAVKPDRAYFGQKDLQQYFVIDQLNRDLGFGVELRMMPIIREPNGLAMSSRNLRLTAEGREKASIIYRALECAGELFSSGSSIMDVKETIRAMFEEERTVELEYFEFASGTDMRILGDKDPCTGQVAICIAVYVEGIRLIDNSLLTLPRD